jgi:hypothetical protein
MADGQFLDAPRAIARLRPCPFDRRASRNRGVKELEVIRSEQNRAVLRQGGDELQQRPVAVLELVYEDKGVGCADDAADGLALKQPSGDAGNSSEIGLNAEHTVGEVHVPRHRCHRFRVPQGGAPAVDDGQREPVNGCNRVRNRSAGVLELVLQPAPGTVHASDDEHSLVISSDKPWR